MGVSNIKILFQCQKIFKFFIIIIYLILIINVTLTLSLTSSFFKEPSVGLGCISFTVLPPSGTIIQNLNSFELMIEFNQNNIRIYDINGGVSLINSLSNQILLDSILYQTNTGSQVFSFWDKISNLTILPIGATTRGIDNRIWLTFSNLPISNSLYFQSDLGIISNDSEVLGPRSIDIFSTNGVTPPKPIINSFFSSCPQSKRIEPNWKFNNPSNPQIFPTLLKVELCNSSGNICKLNQKYYYSLNLPISIAKGKISTILNSITYQGYQYKFKDYPISIQINQDIIVKIPLNFTRYYSPVYESQIVTQYQASPFKDYYTVELSVLDHYISLYNSGYYNQIFIEEVPTNKPVHLFQMNSTVNSNFLYLNYKNVFIFKSSNNNLIKPVYIGTFKPLVYQYYPDYIECLPNSIRNSFTVNQRGQNTIHKLAFLDSFEAYNLELDKMKFIRDLELNFGGDSSSNSSNTVKVNMNNNNSTSDLIKTNDGSVEFSIEFGISSNQYNSLSNSILISQIIDGFVNSSLMIPKSAFGTGMNQIGVDPQDWYNQVGFCNLEHGNNLKNQIQHFKQDGGYTLDVLIPNWINVGGQNNLGKDRTEINKQTSELIMNLNSNQANIKVLIESFQFFEPMIHQDNLTVISVPGTEPGKECNGQFQFDIINIGKESSMVNFDIDCVQDVYIEVLNYAQTIPADNQKRTFHVDVDITKFYKTPIQCKVSMWIDNKPLWSNVNKRFEKNVSMPIFQGCNIPDPCLGINSEPVISKTTTIVQYGDWNQLDNFLNSISLGFQISNIGNQTGDFISTLECTSNIAGVNANFFMLGDINYIITKNVAAGKSAMVQFLLYGESSPVNGLQLHCTILSKLYKPNSICWQNYNDENLLSFNLLYPYDKCVLITGVGNEPFIEFSREVYSNGNAKPFYNLRGIWTPSQEVTEITVANHPLKIKPSSSNINFNNSIRMDQSAIDQLYDSFLTIKVSNGGSVGAIFSVLISNCSNQVYLMSSPTVNLNVLPGKEVTGFFQFYSHATNIKGFSVTCDIVVSTEIKECYSTIGKSFSQSPILVFPHYDSCAGNWLEPSLFKSLAYWDNIGSSGSGSSVIMNFNEFNFKKSKWNFFNTSIINGIENRLFYQDLSIQVLNKEYGIGQVKSSLICSSLSSWSFIETDDESVTKKSSCFLGSNGSCFLNWKLISLSTTPDQELQDNIDCELSIWIEDTEEPIGTSCWTDSGKSIKSFFNLTKLIDPCLPNSFDEVFIKIDNDKQSFELQTSDWGLHSTSRSGSGSEIDNFYNSDYFNNIGINGTSSVSLVYYSYKTIMIENIGNGNGTIKSIITSINNPSVFLISNQSTSKCEILKESYCIFTFLFALIPSKFNSATTTSLSFFNDLEIKIQFLVEPKLCWSSIDKSIEITLKSKLPSLPCGWDPSSPNNISQLYKTPPQVSLIYPNELIIGNLNYYQFTSNSLNLKFSNWSFIKNDDDSTTGTGSGNSIHNLPNQYFKTNLTGYVYNMGDGGGSVVFRLSCDLGNGTKKQYNVIENDEIVSFIPAGGYYNFNFTIYVLDKSPWSLNEKELNPIVTCTVSSIVNLEKCWNQYGKSVIQQISLPLDFKSSNQTIPPTYNNNSKSLLLATLLPIGLILLLILLFLIFKYYRYLLILLNDFKFKNHSNKLINPPTTTTTTTTTNTITPNGDDEKEEKQVEQVKPIIECGCGEKDPKYHCDKCPESISNYCESPLCKNFIHSTTLQNITHNHEPTIIVYRDPRDTWLNNNFKFQPNDKNVEELILNKLNKY